MKTIFFYISIVLIFATITSCQKDKIQDVKITNNDFRTGTNINNFNIVLEGEYYSLDSIGHTRPKRFKT